MEAFQKNHTCEMKQKNWFEVQRGLGLVWRLDVILVMINSHSKPFYERMNNLKDVTTQSPIFNPV